MICPPTLSLHNVGLGARIVEVAVFDPVLRKFAVVTVEVAGFHSCKDTLEEVFLVPTQCSIAEVEELF